MALIDLGGIKLSKMGRSVPEKRMSAMEVVAYIAGEPASNFPVCASPILSAFIHRFADDLDCDRRQLLKPCLPSVIGTAGDGHDDRRGWMCADWLIRMHAPAWLEFADDHAGASMLRSLAEVRDVRALERLSSAIDELAAGIDSRIPGDDARPAWHEICADASAVACDTAWDGAFWAAWEGARTLALTEGWLPTDTALGQARWLARKAAFAVFCPAVLEQTLDEVLEDARRRVIPALQASALELLVRMTALTGS